MPAVGVSVSSGACHKPMRRVMSICRVRGCSMPNGTCPEIGRIRESRYYNPSEPSVPQEYVPFDEVPPGCPYLLEHLLENNSAPC